MAKYAEQPMTEDEIESYVSTLIDYAEDHVETEYRQRREDSWLYYHGGSSVPREEGRHQITMAKTRDMIRMVEPAILRPFATEPNAVEFKPRTPQDAQQAKHQTLGVRYWFYSRNEGYTLLCNAVREAMVADAAVIKTWWDSTPDVSVQTLTNLTAQDVSDLRGSPDVTILSVEGTYAENEPALTVKVQVVNENGRLVHQGVPVENFIFDSGATSLQGPTPGFRIIGHREEMTIADAEARGIDRELALNSVGEDTRSEFEAEARANVSETDLDYVAGVEDNLPVVIYEVYVHMDPSGDGTNELHKVLLAGDGSQRLISYEAVPDHPFSMGSVYPLPHTPVGEGLVHGLKDEQDAATSMMREMLDNLQLSNRPGKEVVEGMVNLDDLMATELGSLVRVRAPNMIKDMAVPFVAAQSLPIMQFLDQQIERKTGISASAMGFSPDMLQSTTKSAVDAANRAGMGQTEYMARNIAETLLKPVFRRSARLLAENMDRAFWVELAGEPVQIDPRGWTSNFDLEVNVGLGSGQPEEKAAVLREVAALQKEILMGRGVDNGLVSVNQFVNTLSDILALSGLHNPARYFGPVTPEVVQGMLAKEQQAKQAPQGGDPTQGLVEAEKIKTQGRMEEAKLKASLDTQKAALDAKLRAVDGMKRDDLARDKMLQELVLSAIEIQAKYGAQVDIASLRAEQARNTPPTNGGTQQ